MTAQTKPRATSAKKAAPRKPAGLSLVADRAELVAAADAAARIASAKSAAPVLTCAKLTLASNDLTIEATDVSISMETTIEVVGKSDGVVAVNARLLADTLRACSEDKVTLTWKGGRLHVKSGTFEAALFTQPEDEFPKPGPRLAKDALVSYASESFRESLFRVLPAVSTDEARPTIASLLFDLAEDGVQFVGTDSYRLTSDVVEGEAPPRQILIPGRSAEEIGKAVMASKAETVEVGYGTGRVGGQDRIVVFAGAVRLEVVVTEGEYPNYRGLIPTESTTIVSVDRKALATAISRCKLYSRGNEHDTVLVTVDPSKITVTAAGDQLGSGRDVVDAEAVGDPVAVGFSASRLLDVLRVCPGEKVEMHLIDALKPVIVSAPDAPRLVSLLMPVRMPNDQASNPEPKAEGPEDDEDEGDEQSGPETHPEPGEPTTEEPHTTEGSTTA